MTTQPPEINTSLSEIGVLHIELNRPEQRNALHSRVLSQLKTILVDAKKNNAVRGILITGSGKLFCAGADIPELKLMHANKSYAFAKHGQDVFLLLEQLGKPSVAAIHGAALGGGLELAMACTFRIAEKNAIFGQPEIKLGVLPGFGGTQRLPLLIGKGKALELCLTGKSIHAETALQWGLVNDIAPMEELETRALELLSSIVQYGQIAIQSILHCMNTSQEHGQHLEALYFSACSGTKDKEEGVNAFLEKRKAQFTGE